MEEVRERLQAELADRYVVGRELGRGGVAVVYLARDLRHERSVALKVLRSDVAGRDSDERFFREIRTIANLHHPHILPLYDSGSAGGHFFYVMPYVEGETLRDRLAREGQLPVDDAVRLTREVAEALEFAHSHGIVHRDIKPANILLNAGHAIVADFGIAKAIDVAGIQLTETGLAVGTPAYMSPEQSMADPRVDARTDQYALGCVLYEMLAGEPPFTGPSGQAVMARHNITPVPSLAPVRAVSPTLEAALRKALAKAPADRWPSIRAFADSLDRPVAESGTSESPKVRRSWTLIGTAAAAIALIAALTWGLTSDRGKSRGALASPAESVRSVAVLPFTLSGDTTQSMIADGMTEGVITSLVRVEGLRVPASGRMLAYRDRQEDPRAVARALGVAAMVTGAMQVAGNKFRVTAQLTRADDGTVLWRDQFNGELVTNGQLRDLFTIQDDITGQIVDALLPKLAPASRAAIARGVRTKDPEAWKAYLQARRIGYQLTEASTGKAKALLEQAIARDPEFSDAWAALVHVLDFAARFSTEPPEHFNAAIRRAANRAIETDPENGFAYAQRALFVLGLQDWDWDGALRDIQRAVKLSPASTDVLREYAVFHIFMKNEPDTVLAYARRAFDSTAIAWDLMTWGYVLNGKPDSALAAAERAVAVDPGHVWGYLWLATFYLDAGRGAAANRAIEQFLEGAGNDAQGIGWAAVYYRQAGNAEGARAMLDRLTAVSKKRTWGVHSAMSMVRLALGDRDGALDALEEAARRREYLLPATLAGGLDPLRREPRFLAVRKTVFGNRKLPERTFF